MNGVHLGTEPDQLGPEQRSHFLRRAAEDVFDLIVVGGGITGAGIALDAASRGLSVALFEQNDWAQGTSSRSSKLIHGGLRYLEQLQFGLVREALREQTLLIERIGPHLVRPIPFLLPVKGRLFERFYFGAGLLLYDLVGGRRAIPRHRHLGFAETRKRFPALRPEAFSGGIQYYDAQVDDSRLVMTILRTAAAHGASLLSRTRVNDFLRDRGRVVGVSVRCSETDSAIEVRGRRVISAVGVWSEEVQSWAGGRGLRVKASKGIHLVVPRECIPGSSALILKTTKSILLAIPWRRHWLIGTTDTAWRLDLERPAATQIEIDYLLDQINRVLSNPIRREDIHGVYVGLRPLLQAKRGDTASISRKHRVKRMASGLISIAGGKLTTYREMAKDAVDSAVRDWPRKVSKSRTQHTPLIGAEGYPEAWESRQALALAAQLDVSKLEELIGRYGDRVTDLLLQMQKEKALREPVPGAEHYLAAEIAYAVTHEGALRLEDVLERRTHIHIETPDRGLRAVPEVVAIMGDLLGWSAERREAELDEYTKKVAAEHASQRELSDLMANHTRLNF